MDFGLRKKVAIITGGGSGIGRIIAHMLAEEGADVVVADINGEGATKVATEVRKKGVESLAIQSDVGQLEETNKLAEKTIERFGRIDILIHGAAFFNVQPFMKTSPDDWEKVIRIGQVGAMNCSRSVLVHMISAKGGRIIFIGSDAGRIGDSFQPIYAAAKAGIMAFAKSIAQDMGRHGITINVVSPALTLTEENRTILNDMYGLNDEKRASRLLFAYPMRKLGTSEDVASMVVFLASERAGDITGQIISVNGGFCMV
jgi:NAD(P)-dependent dehydrogenase (short-subunit alcohol dehydrogenase family)